MGGICHQVHGFKHILATVSRGLAVRLNMNGGLGWGEMIGNIPVHFRVEYLAWVEIPRRVICLGMKSSALDMLSLICMHGK